MIRIATVTRKCGNFELCGNILLKNTAVHYLKSNSTCLIVNWQAKTSSNTLADDDDH